MEILCVSIYVYELAGIISCGVCECEHTGVDISMLTFDIKSVFTIYIHILYVYVCLCKKRTPLQENGIICGFLRSL